MSMEIFNQHKAKFHEQEQVIVKVQAEISKNDNILKALKNELNEIISRSKEKMANNQMLSADEYVELKQQDSGLKARIEYYEALAHDLTAKLETEKEVLATLKDKLEHIRRGIFNTKAEEIMQSIFATHQKELSQLYMYLKHSYEFPLNEHLVVLDKQQEILAFICDKMKNHINTDEAIPAEFSLYSVHLANYEAKSPARKHREAHTETAKNGLNHLINNLIA